MKNASIETLAAKIKTKHALTTLHIFDQGGGWSVFGFRQNPKGYQASSEVGRGETIEVALQNLDARLVEGPIHR